MSPGVQCPTCKTFSVSQLREDPPGVQLWRCTQCGEVKRWCPVCNQGWVLHYVKNATGESLYCCDECEATWQEPTEIGGTMPTLEGLEHALALVRDIEK